MQTPDTEREALGALMRQYEADIKSAHAEMMKAQGLAPTEHTWPAWTPQANTLRWIGAMREKFGIPATN